MNRRATRTVKKKTEGKRPGRKPGTGLPLFKIVVKLSTPNAGASCSVHYEIRAKNRHKAIATARVKAKEELPQWNHSVESCLQLSKPAE